MANLAESLAQFTLQLRYSDLPTDVKLKIRASLIHNVSCAMAALESVQPARVLAVATQVTSGGARELEAGLITTPALAALVNGSLMHSRGQDDFHGGVNGHIGAVIIPAALAVGETTGASREELLAAMVAGYEVYCAVGDGFSALTTPRGFRSTSIYGPLGAAAAAAKLLGLDAAGTASAINLAANFAGGFTQVWLAGTSEYPYHAGWAAKVGVEAAHLAAAGLRAAPDTLEGPRGFYTAHCGGVQDLSAVTAGLGQRWRTTELRFKPYPLSGIMQNPTHTLLSLLKEHGIQADMVDRIELWMNDFEYSYPGTNAPSSRSISSSVMNARFCLALALRHGEVKLRHLKEFADSDQIAMMGRIAVHPDSTLPHLCCRLAITLRDGRVVSEERRTSEKLAWGLDEVKVLALSLAEEAGIAEGAMATFFDDVMNQGDGSAVTLMDRIQRLRQ